MGKKTLFRGGLIYYNLNERLQAQFIHVAVILQRGWFVGEEDAVGVFDVAQHDILHCDGFGAVGVGGHVQCAALGNVARLRLEGPEVTIQGHVQAGEDGHIRSAKITEATVAVNNLPTKVADDEEAFVVGRHEEHRLDVEAQ